MAPTTVVPLAVETAELLSKVIGTRAKRSLAEAASFALQPGVSSTESAERVRVVLRDAAARVRLSWEVGLILTILLFVLFVSLAITAVVVGLVLGHSVYGIVFGGVSGVSLFTVLLWKPYDRVFQALVIAQRLDIVLATLDQSWSNCWRIADPAAQTACVTTASQAALAEIARVA